MENSEHIDAERARKNIYWDCYRGFTTHDFRENPEQPDYSFEEIERMYYTEHYSDHVDAQNARNEKTRHTERNRTVEDLLFPIRTTPKAGTTTGSRPLMRSVGRSCLTSQSGMGCIWIRSRLMADVTIWRSRTIS